MAAYTDAQKIANHLGVALTPAQITQADVVAEAITVWIDHRTGRTWQNATGTVVDEIDPVSGSAVYLQMRPVIAVSALDLKVRGGNNPWTPLDPSQYTLVDPAAGLVEISGVAQTLEAAYDARTDYTSQVTAPPADIAYAATIISSEVLFTMLHPESAGVDSIAVGQNDINIRYATGTDAETSSGAALAVRIVDAYRRVVLA